MQDISTLGRPVLSHVMAEPTDFDHFPEVSRTLTERPELTTCIATLAFSGLQDKPFVAVSRTAGPYHEALDRLGEVAKLSEEHHLFDYNRPDGPLTQLPLFPSGLLMAVASTVEELHITINENSHIQPLAQIN